MRTHQEGHGAGTAAPITAGRGRMAAAAALRSARPEARGGGRSRPVPTCACACRLRSRVACPTMPAPMPLHLPPIPSIPFEFFMVSHTLFCTCFGFLAFFFTSKDSLGSSICKLWKISMKWEAHHREFLHL